VVSLVSMYESSSWANSLNVSFNILWNDWIFSGWSLSSWETIENCIQTATSYTDVSNICSYWCLLLCFNFIASMSTKAPRSTPADAILQLKLTLLISAHTLSPWHNSHKEKQKKWHQQTQLPIDWSIASNLSGGMCWGILKQANSNFVCVHAASCW
jgi:hypothetical protein